MTEETATNPVVAEDVHVPAAEGVEATDQVDTTAPAPEQDNPEPEFAEVEYDGQTYRVPPALKDAVLRHSDYTRKTQEVADLRRGLAAREAEIAQQAEAQRAFVKEHGRVEHLNDVVAEFETYDWGAWFDQNPEQARADWNTYQRTLTQRAQAQQTLQTRQQQAALEAQRTHATRLQQAHAEVAQEIKDWSPKLAQTLTDFGKSLGYSDDELSAADPKAVKVLHLAYQAHQHEQQRAKAAEIAKAQQTTPAQTLRGPAGRFEVSPETDDFAAFERLANARRAKG